MKILLSYSKLHFDPDKNSGRQKYRGLSASILAESLYQTLSRFGDVTYIDSNEYKEVMGNRYDLFVGIANNFDRILKACSFKKSIFWAVNRHPRDRNASLIKYFLQEKLSPFSFSGWDFHNIFRIGNALKQVDYILCLGNSGTYNSYLKYGIPKNKIKCLNYDTGHPHDDWTNRRPGKKLRFLHLASEIGIRKGFDIVFDLFTDERLREWDFTLDIAGTPTNRHYERKLQSLLLKLGPKARYHGWIPAEAKKYTQIIHQSDFLVFPSIEEGQPGTILDCLKLGIIPLPSRASGVDWAPLGYLETKRNSAVNQKILEKCLSLNRNGLTELKKKTAVYYREFHSNFRQNLREILEQCLQDRLYPPISVVLPIFNKQKTIIPLLLLLHEALKEYGNSELIIYFDGCRDKTESIVRDFFRNKNEYPVIFETTPNIFEIKTNNLGMKKAGGTYVAVLQDDNYVFDRNVFFEAVNFLEKNKKTAILGGLAGVNYYPLGYSVPGNRGQIVQSQDEVYWRQDARTNPELAGKFFETDAVMRGPIFFRKSFLEHHGYLDEIYAPLHQDDMDICFRARKMGFRIFCFLSNTLNISLTVARYDEHQSRFWAGIVKRNTGIFYRRWKPTIYKDYFEIYREPVYKSLPEELDTKIKMLYLHKEKLMRYLQLSYEKLKRIISL